MAYLYTVRLEKLEWYAHHGVHTCEKELGNRFQIDVAVTFKTQKPVQNLSQTVDYAQLAHVCYEVMYAQKTDLLETLAHQIIDKLQSKFCFLVVQKISVKISKHNPPIGYLCEKSSVELVKEYC